jgi:ABC-type sugar transport system ATPase subunit
VAEPLLAARAISKTFTVTPALDRVDFHLNAGEVLALVGENGAGKSTLIKILSGVLLPDAGTLSMDGEVLHLRSADQAEKQGIATVYQELSLFPDLSVAENLLLGHYPKRAGLISRRRLREQAAALLARFGVSLDLDAPVSSLSIADKYLLEICKALHRRARVLILDEPTAVLGTEDVERLFDVIRSLRREGTGVVFISHRLDEVFAIADRFMVLKDGVMVGEGPIEQTDHDDLVSRMVGRELSELAVRSAPPADRREVLRVEELSSDVLRSVSFSVSEGEIVGIAGLRGAGRTELVRAIFGADPIDAGRVLIDGKAVRIGSPTQAIRNGVGLVPEERATQGVLKALSVAQNISLVKMASRGARRVRPTHERRSAQQYVERLNIRPGDTSLPAGSLSGGNQQKAVLAKWIEAGASVLLLDEPTRGIDIGSKRQIYETVGELCSQGLAVVVISSELLELLEVCDRILVMYRGGIAGELDRSEATEEAIMKYAVGGGVPA